MRWFGVYLFISSYFHIIISFFEISRSPFFDSLSFPLFPFYILFIYRCFYKFIFAAYLHTLAHYFPIHACYSSSQEKMITQRHPSIIRSVNFWYFIVFLFFEFWILKFKILFDLVIRNVSKFMEAENGFKFKFKFNNRIKLLDDSLDCSSLNVNLWNKNKINTTHRSYW